MVPRIFYTLLVMPYYSNNNIEIFYEIQGKGPPLVLIHGLGSSLRDWERQVTYFSKYYKILSFDVRGHGRSGKPLGPYSVPMFASDAAELIRFLNMAPAHVVGISMGGMIAFQLSVDASDVIRTLVIVNSGPELILRTPVQQAAFFYRKLIVRFMGVRGMGRILARKLFPMPDQKYLRRLMIERWAQNDKRTYMDALNAIIGWSVADRISEIQCPTLVMTADQDYTPVSYKRTYARQIPGAEVAIIQNSRHLSPADQPARFNAALMAFLETH